MTEFSAIIVEDSRLARVELKELLKKHHTLTVVAEAENVDVACEKIAQFNPDVIFLDINMPEKDGFDLLQVLDQLPEVIFTTAYDEYAIKAFEHNAFDYLLKPISQERFDQSIEKLMLKLSMKNHKRRSQKLDHNSQIFIKEGEDCWIVSLSQITLFEIMGNYTRVFFDDKKPLIYKSLNKIEQSLPDDVFFRANRQQIINLKHITKIESWFKGILKIKLKSGHVIEVSRRQSHKFRQQLEL